MLSKKVLTRLISLVACDVVALQGRFATGKLFSCVSRAHRFVLCAYPRVHRTLDLVYDNQACRFYLIL